MHNSIVYILLRNDINSLIHLSNKNYVIYLYIKKLYCIHIPEVHG